MSEALRETDLRTRAKGPQLGVLLDRLRNETREDHQRLEDGLGLLDPNLDLCTYVQILSRFYGFYLPWETNVAGMAAGILPNFAARQQKVRNLAVDLNYLGVEPKDLPLCDDVPPCHSVLPALGGLYVTEGATLGGQIISRHVRQVFSFPEGEGDLFFRSYGNKVGSMWSEFRAVLGGYSSDSADEVIIDGAKRMFRALGKWLGEGK